MMSSLMPMMPSFMAFSQPRGDIVPRPMPMAAAKAVAEASTSMTFMPQRAATIIYI